MWFGWYGFNIGSAILVELTPATAQLAALAAVNTSLGAGVGGITALLFEYMILRYTSLDGAHFDIQFAINGCLVGIVSITAGCFVMEPFASAICAFTAGILYVISNHWLVRMRIDDAIDAAPVHLVGGVWGTICVGLMSSPQRQQAAYNRSDHVGLFYSWRNGDSDFTLLVTQILGLLCIILWTLVIMAPFFLFLDYWGLLRCQVMEEIIGLDAHEHGGLEKVEERPENIDNNHFEAFKKKRERNRASSRIRDVSRSQPSRSSMSISISDSTSGNQKEDRVQ